MADSFDATDLNRNRFSRGQRQPEHKRVGSVRIHLDACPIIDALRFGLTVDFHATCDCLPFFKVKRDQQLLTDLHSKTSNSFEDI